MPKGPRTAHFVSGPKNLHAAPQGFKKQKKGADLSPDLQNTTWHWWLTFDPPYRLLLEIVVASPSAPKRSEDRGTTGCGGVAHPQRYIPPRREEGGGDGAWGLVCGAFDWVGPGGRGSSWGAGMNRDSVESHQTKRQKFCGHMSQIFLLYCYLVLYNVMPLRCGTAQCNTVQYNAMQCSAMHCNNMICGKIR